MQEFLADTSIQTDPLGDLLDIGTNGFTQISNLVDEGDLHGQECVRGVFDQLGCAAIGEQDRRFIDEERAVKLAHEFLRALIICTHDHAVWNLEVLDCCTFAQEFRVGDNCKITVWALLANDRFYLVTSPDRNGRLGDDDSETVHVVRDFICNRIDIGQVGMSVATT